MNEHHLNYYYFIGRVVGMAAFHNRLIDGFFIRPFYKMMLNKPIVLQDIEAVDGEYYKSMKFIMDSNDEELESLDLVFTSESDVYGQVCNLKKQKKEFFSKSFSLVKDFFLLLESRTRTKTQREKH